MPVISSAYLPIYPTTVDYVWVINDSLTDRVVIGPGGKAQLKAYGTYYDCTTWGTVYNKTGELYYGYKAGGTVEPVMSDPITVLAEVTATPNAQTFAFDFDYDDLEYE